jgi:hypothetical protein
MGLKYQKFQNGDKIVYSGERNNNVFHYVGQHPMNPDMTFVCLDKSELIVIMTDVINERYEHYYDLEEDSKDKYDELDTMISEEDRLKKSLLILEKMKGFKKNSKLI